MQSFDIKYTLNFRHNCEAFYERLFKKLKGLEDIFGLLGCIGVCPSESISFVFRKLQNGSE